MNTLTDRELRWLRHIAIHGPQSSEFLLELVSDTHRCRDTGLRTLQKLREHDFLRLPPQQQQIAKADFNPYVYDLTRKSELYLRGIGDPKTVRPSGHWWHTFLTACITSAIDLEARRRGYRYIPAHEILDRSGASLAIPIGTQKLIPDQLFAIDYGGAFRSFVLEVDRGTEPLRSQAGRKSVGRMIEQYVDLIATDRLRSQYRLTSKPIVLLTFNCPQRATMCLEAIETATRSTQASLCIKTCHAGFPRSGPLKEFVVEGWSRAQDKQFLMFEVCS